MSTANAYLTVSGLGVDVVYKHIKNLHISVYPPFGRVRVAAPERMDEDTIRRAIIQRLPWIRRQREQLENADRQSERQMLSGETHYVWGQRYRLDVSRVGRPRVEAKAQTLWVVAPEGSSAVEQRAVLDRWYRRQLRAALPPLVERWQRELDIGVPKIGIRRMKTKWGTYTPGAGTIWLNPELAKKSPRCLEYILVHEMTHVRERTHNQAFVELMDRTLPDWRSRRDELNSAPLAAEDWGDAS